MNTLVDFNSARHDLKHGQIKEDSTRWMSLKEIAQTMDLTVPKARAIIQKAVRTQKIKNLTKPGSRGMQALYAVEMVNQLKKLYAAGTLSRPRSGVLNFIPFVGRSYALLSMGKALYDSGVTQALVHRLNLKKWERKAKEFAQGHARHAILSKWNELKAVAEKDYEILFQKFMNRNAPQFANKKTTDSKMFEKLS